MTTYSRSYNPIWYFRDLVGQPLDDTYYAFFLTNTIPYLPQTIYQDENGNVPWSNPIEFLADGSLPENMYFPDNTVYRIEIRAGNTQAAALIKLIPNYVPLVTPGTTPVSAIANADNQITNPQFVEISFNDTLSLTSVTDVTVQVAPGWDLVGVGTGSLIISQLEFQGSDNHPTNPSYGLEVEASGSFSQVYLRQRFENNGALWSRAAVSASITAANLGGGTPDISVDLIASDAESTTIIPTTALTNDYVEIKAAIAIPVSSNPDLPTSAYTDFIINLPTNGTVGITSVQICQQDAVVALSYNQTTIERQVDHTFHYYKNSMLIMPKKSLLTGWNFAMNPWQFSVYTGTTFATASAAYTADQTILYSKNGANQLSYGQSAAATNLGLEIGALTATNQFAIIQYINPQSTLPYWQSVLSSLVKATYFGVGNLPFKMRLIYRNSLPPTLSAVEPIASWAGAEPVFAAGWTALAPINDPTYNMSTSFPNAGVSFNGFQLPTASTMNDTLGIVVYTTDDMAQDAYIIFDKISLVPNEFACDEQPQTFDQTQNECQAFYEKTYEEGVQPGDVSTGFILYPQNLVAVLTSYAVYPSSFDLQFNTLKIMKTPLVNVYPADGGSVGNVQLIVRNSTPGGTAATNQVNTQLSMTNRWTQATVSEKWVAFYHYDDTALVSNAVVPNNAEAFLQVQITIDARLGLV